MDVSVQRETDGRLLVTLAAQEREVNLHLSTTDIRALVESNHWHERGTLRAGESAGVPVFWASDGNQAKLLIGHGDENRDDAIIIPFRAVNEIVRGAMRTEVPSEPVTQSYEPPPPDDGLVTRLRAAIASIPDLHEAYLVARRTVTPNRESLELGVVGALAPSRNRRGIEAVRTALTPFTPPSESAPLDWCAYSHSPVPDDVRRAGIRLV